LNYKLNTLLGKVHFSLKIYTQGKIERYHRTMKNVVKLDNYSAPEELEAALQKFVNRYNNERYH
jgi:transposase InsO family protein